MRIVTAGTEEGKNIRVWLNFKEVTNRTYYAELHKYPFVPIIGLMKMWEIDEKGKHYRTDEGEIAKEEIRGIVWFCYKEHEKL